MRYYDKSTHSEVFEESETTVPQTDDSVSWWFQPLHGDERVLYWTDDMPYKYTGTFYEPIVVDGIVVEGMSQEEIDMILSNHETEVTYQELLNQLNDLTIEFMGYTFSGSQEQQAFVVSMLTKIEGENPNSTRNIYAIDGRTKVPMTKSDMYDFMDVVDIAQEAITDV